MSSIGVGELAESFVALADTHSPDFDPDRFLHGIAARLRWLPAVDAAGVLLTCLRSEHRTARDSSGGTGLAELLDAQDGEGPWRECAHDGVPVSVDLPAADDRSPRLAELAARAGIHSVQVLPLRLREEVLGAVTMFRSAAGAMAEPDLRVARAIADVATIGLVQRRTLCDQAVRAEQLQHALDSRVVIEQAKGVVAEHLSTTVDDAFARLRRHARTGNHQLRAVALDVVERRLSPADLAAPPH